MKIVALALLGTLVCNTAIAQTVVPFKSDGCVPGLNALGQFIDEADNVLKSNGWVVTAAQKVINAKGQQVFLKPSCAGLLGGGNSVEIVGGNTMGGTSALAGGTEVAGVSALAVGGAGIAAALGVVAIALATSSTNSTN